MKEGIPEQVVHLFTSEEFNVHSQYLSFLFGKGSYRPVAFCMYCIMDLLLQIRGWNYLFFLHGAYSHRGGGENILDVNKGRFLLCFFLLFLMAENADKCYQATTLKRLRLKEEH